MLRDASTVEAIPCEVKQPQFVCRWLQRWKDALFLHWRVESEALRRVMPEPLEIDTFDGEAWASLVLFRMDIRPRGCFPIPFASALPELNLRTYVHRDGAPGIYFLSVHTNHRLLGRLASVFSPMRYHQAQMIYRRTDETFEFDATSRSAPTQSLCVAFDRRGTELNSERGGVDDWLLERYRLYIEDGRGGICHGDVEHPRWPVQDVDVSIIANTMGAPFGLPLDFEPHAAHFSPGVDVRFGKFCASAETPVA